MLNRKLICAAKRNFATLSENWANRIDHLAWYKKPTEILPKQKAKWFANGTTNMSYNCIEPHRDPTLTDVPAIYYANITAQKDGFLTFGQLRQKVSQYVDVLKRCGVQKGSKIYIYLPNTIESVCTILACGVLGAVFDFHYYGVGINDIARSLKTTDPMLIVTTSCTIEADGISEYKSYVDKARKMVNKEIKCLVIQREYKKVSNLSENDIDFDELKRNDNTTLEYAELPSDHPLYIFDSMVVNETAGGTQFNVPKLTRPTGPYLVGLDQSVHRTLGLFGGSNIASLANLASTIGLAYTLYGPLLAGASTIVLEDLHSFPKGGIDLITKYKLKNMLMHTNLFKKSFEANNNIIEQLDLDFLGLFGRHLMPEFNQLLQEKARKSQTFITYALYNNEMGIIAACDDWTTPIEKNTNFDVKPIEDVIIEQKPGTTQLVVKQPIYPGFFDGFLKQQDKNRLEGLYFDENGSFRLDVEGEVKDGILKIKDQNEIENPFCLISGVKVPKKLIEDTIKDNSNVADAYIHTFYDEVDGQTFLVFLDLKNEIKNEDNYNIIEDIKSHLTDKLGKLAIFKDFIIIDELPEIDNRGKKLNKKMLFDIVENIKESEYEKIPQFQSLKKQYLERTDINE